MHNRHRENEISTSSQSFKEDNYIVMPLREEFPRQKRDERVREFQVEVEHERNKQETAGIQYGWKLGAWWQGARDEVRLEK